MSIAFRVLPSFGCTVSLWDGVVTTEEAQNHIIRVAEHPDWPPGPLHLTDLSTLRRGVVPDAELLNVLYEGTTLTTDLRVAVIVAAAAMSTSELHFRSAASVLAAVPFDNLEAACAYLGVPATSLAPVLVELREELR